MYANNRFSNSYFSQIIGSSEQDKKDTAFKCLYYSVKWGFFNIKLGKNP